MHSIPDSHIAKMPFIVPEELTMFCQVPSPVAGRVLTLERAFYAWTIYEYTDPLSRGRQWMYDLQQSAGEGVGVSVALAELIAYAHGTTRPSEPDNWTRAIDYPNGHFRMRRQRFHEDGTRYVIDTTPEER